MSRYMMCSKMLVYQRLYLQSCTHKRASDTVQVNAQMRSRLSCQKQLYDLQRYDKHFTRQGGCGGRRERNADHRRRPETFYAMACSRSYAAIKCRKAVMKPSLTWGSSQRLRWWCLVTTWGSSRGA